jgi:glycosyltransferase involved in cell wall biosynthesis
MRILFVSNYLSHSGYARQARIVVPAIIEMGHEVEVLSVGNPHNKLIMNAPDGVRLLPLGRDVLANDIVRHHYRAGNFDAVMTMTDVWGLDPNAYKDLNWYPFAPIDTYNLTPDHAGNIRTCNFPIAISRFGQKVIMQETGIQSEYMPLMVDTEFWQPGDKAESRRQLSIDQDAIMFMFVGVNDTYPSRKGISELLQAWAACGDELPPKAFLHMHTAKVGGVDIPSLANSLNIPPARLRITDDAQYHIGMPDDIMLLMAQASDCLIQPSRREGACLPLIEWQACGVPVIATDGHAQRQYNKTRNWIGGQMALSAFGTWEYVPRIDSIRENILLIAGKRSDKVAGELLRGLVVDNHAIPHVIENYLKPIVNKIAMDVLSRE